MIKNIHINEADLSKYQIFDVRCPFEWEEGVLAGAEKVPLYDNRGFLNSNFVDEVKAKIKDGKELAFVCKAGQRSFMAANMIEEALGLDSVNLDGGMSSYKGEF